MDATTLVNLDIFANGNPKLLEPNEDFQNRYSCTTTFHKRERQNQSLTDKSAAKGTLTNVMQVLDHTSTAFGHRLLRKWICFPITA